MIGSFQKFKNIYLLFLQVSRLLKITAKYDGKVFEGVGPSKSIAKVKYEKRFDIKLGVNDGPNLIE